tara:strand:- start:70 stop:678 length:609 start_codon:yes stop_codon:yes gene_type:complete
MTNRILPEHIHKTSYDNIFITKSGDVYREPVKGERMPINEYGLVYLKPAYRGHKDYPAKQYECVNISLRDENGNFIRQIKKSVHQLVAETFIPNPNGYTEILHGEKGNRCNDVSNLKWGTHIENMEGVISPCTTPKTYTITDTRTGNVYKGMNLAQFCRNHMDILNDRTKTAYYKNDYRAMSRLFANARCKKSKIWGFIVEY